MPLDERARSRRSDPGVTLLNNALHDGAVVLDAYARFATTLIGVLVFPYGRTRPAMNARGEEPAETPAHAPRPLGHRGIMQVAIAFLVGALLGRKLLRRRLRTR